MRNRIATLGVAPAVLVVTGLLAAGPALAQLNNGQEQAVVAVHAQANNHVGLPSCTDINPDLSCNDFTTSWPTGSPAVVYFVVARADSVLGICAVSLGVDYGMTPGVQADGRGCDVFGYTSCADYEFRSEYDPNDASTTFPAAGAGARLMWLRDTNCQRRVVGSWGVQTVACLFYVYAYGRDQLMVDMNRNEYFGPELQILDCTLALSDMPFPSHAGYVDFGGGSGYNPCLELGPVPAVRTTWGRLKSQYE